MPRLSLIPSFVRGVGDCVCVCVHGSIPSSYLALPCQNGVAELDYGDELRRPGADADLCRYLMEKTNGKDRCYLSRLSMLCISHESLRTDKVLGNSAAICCSGIVEILQYCSRELGTSESRHHVDLTS